MHTPLLTCAEKESRGQCQWQWGGEGTWAWDRGRSQALPEEVTFQYEGLPQIGGNELILQHGFWVGGISPTIPFHQWLFRYSFQGGLHRSLETAFI